MSDSKQNRLGQETSPYLLQHAHNPVDWYPWGEEALKRAKREQLPVFLSVGYSACHWCHVMERESFEDPQVAEFLNKNFVSIKVDREERPDIDHIYMNAVQVLTQHGGWPMSVFLTPDLEPFYGGTYFPPDDRHGLPSFKRVITSVQQAWASKKDDVKKSARQLVQALEQLDAAPSGGEKIGESLITNGVHTILRHFDTNFGGFGGAPKFFHTTQLRLLLREFHRSGDATALNAVAFTLEKMAAGGIFDQIGGGFHRYSVDAEWHVPHFEKMLYDNALLPEVYLEAFQLTGNFAFAGIARRVLDYLIEEMQSPAGGFYSTQDADSEGIEGRYYVWTPGDIEKTLGDFTQAFCLTYDISAGGNWEHGLSIARCQRPQEAIAKELGIAPAELEERLTLARHQLLKVRKRRTPPLTDTKILLSWNGMAVHALALGFQILGDKKYLAAAQRAAQNLEQSLASPARTPSGGQLLYRVFNGRGRYTAHLDDYAHWIDALISLYESDFNPAWLKTAEMYCNTLLDEFWDADSCSFFFTGHSHEKLVIRPRESHDGATPGATAMAITALLRLHSFTGDTRWLSPAKQCLERNEPQLRLAPQASAQALLALDGLLRGTQEIAIVAGESGEETQEVLDKVRSRYSAARAIAFTANSGAADLPPLLAGKKAIDGKTTVYVCRKFQCEQPLVGLEAISEQF